MGRLCAHLKKVTKTDQFCDIVCAEWLLYASDPNLDSTKVEGCVDICAYWKLVSSMVDATGERKYKNLSFVAKAALSLSHSNASPERGFSVNNALLTKEKGSLSERTIIGLRIVKEAIRLYGSVSDVPITKELLHAVKQAHSQYALFLENARKQMLLEEEERKRKEKVDEDKKSMERTKSSLYEQLAEQEKLEESQLLEQATARELISDASKKLTEAVQDSGKNVQAVKVAQMMLNAGNEQLNKTAKQLADIKQQKDKLHLKLRKLEAGTSERRKHESEKKPAKRQKVQ